MNADDPSAGMFASLISFDPFISGTGFLSFSTVTNLE